MIAVAAIHAALRDLIDPEVGINVVDLGLIGEVVVTDDGAVVVDLRPTTPGCPLHDALAAGVQRLIGDLPGVSAVEVHVVCDPPWTPDRIAPAARVQLGWRQPSCHHQCHVIRDTVPHAPGRLRRKVSRIK